MTLEELLKQAIESKRDEFRAALIQQAEESDDHSRGTINPKAKQGAINRRDACLAVYDSVGLGRINEITGSTGRVVIAHNIACKLMEVPAHKRTAMLVDWEERQTCKP